MHYFAYFPTDPVEIMEEVEILENKTSEDKIGGSGKLLKNVSTEIAPALSYIYNVSLETRYSLIVGKCPELFLFTKKIKKTIYLIFVKSD